ncbi:DNA pilot protein [Blackfly microvirus SF02]|uniref:DNA pilot protein n=1 Tax=Blackfly microvirus SF02 TaxID=2576452 RepID=A0A4P8PJR7_9VIRU|nr:DNA pilot protein [Blackfly microvirus SF02]
MSGAVWGEVANAAIQAGTAWLNSDAQRDANRINIKNSREQRDFERDMSNTAIQRRATDIELAGGNRALAFVNGSEASTPSYTPARVEAPRIDAPRFNTAALMQSVQTDNIKADTFKKSAETRSMTLDSDYKEAVMSGRINFQNQGSALDLETKKLQMGKLQEEIAKVASDREAQQIANFIANETKEDAIKAIKSGALLRMLGIPGAENSAKWNEIKRKALDWLEHPSVPGIDYGTWHGRETENGWTPK